MDPYRLIGARCLELAQLSDRRLSARRWASDGGSVEPPDDVDPNLSRCGDLSLSLFDPREARIRGNSPASCVRGVVMDLNVG